MPYSIIKVKGGYQVKNKETGHVMAKHTTKEKAEAQIRAIYANKKKK